MRRLFLFLSFVLSLQIVNIPSYAEEKADGPTLKTPLELTVEGAIILALANNRALKVELLNPSIKRTQEEQEKAVFDTILDAKGSFSRQSGIIRSRTGIQAEKDEATSAEAGLSRFLETGTTLGLSVSTIRTRSDLYGEMYETRPGISITQALLRGAGREVNLARLRQARLATGMSLWELKGFCEALTASVEETYWDYVLAVKEIEIFQRSLVLAEDQLREIEELIAVGRLAETEVTAAKAEIALQRQGLIEAMGNADKTRLKLIRLLNPPDMWSSEMRMLQEPTIPMGARLDTPEAHVALALRLRAELCQARLAIESAELELVRTRNGLLPRMDFFIALGKTGYAESFGPSFEKISDRYYDISGGLALRFPLENSEAKALHKRAVLKKDQAREALSNLEQLVELEVRSAYIEVIRAREKIGTGEASRRLEEEKLMMETEKLRVGRSTAFLVSQAQRDLLSSRIKEIRFVTDYLKALVRLYLLDGSLLARRGLELPEG